MAGIEKMRNIFKDVSNSDPLSYITIASHCQSIYTSLFMPEKSIPINMDEFNERYISSKKPINGYLLIMLKIENIK